MLRPAFSKVAGQLPKPTGVDFFEAILNEQPGLKALFPKHTTSAFFGAAPKGVADFTELMAYFPSQGQCAYTVITGDKVFKAPCDTHVPGAEDMVEQIEKEAKILRYLEGKGLPVPELIYEGKETVFIGMTRMKGVKLDSAVIDKMTYQEKRQLAKDIAGFIAGFENAISDQDAEILGFNEDALTTRELKPEDSRLVLSDSGIVEVLKDDMDFCSDMQKAFEERYERKYRDVPQTLSHGDLHLGNILYDPETNRLSGVIDFGRASFCHPETNFIPFSRDCKDDFTSMLCEEYSEKSGNKITLRDVRISENAYRIVNLFSALVGGNKKEIQCIKQQISELKKSLAPEPKKNVSLSKALKT